MFVKVVQNAPKKDAITTAVSNANYEWIITTDADCTLPKNWLRSFDQYIQAHNAVLIAGPVCLDPAESFLQKFQQLDVFSLQTTTMGSFAWQLPLLCNGANLAYKKQVFEAVNGFMGNDHIASGDDIFMLEKMKFAQKKIDYLSHHEAQVKTLPPQNLKALFQQRVRWAAKTSAYKNPISLFTAVVVFLANLGFMVFALGAILKIMTWQAFLILFVVKFNIDFLILYNTAAFYQNLHLLKNYVIIAFLHPIFVTSTAMQSFLTSYEWKGRTYHK